MTVHQLTATCKRKVETELTLDEDGKIDEETVVNVGPASRVEEYNCGCGSHFERYKVAANHIIEEREEREE